MTVRSHQTIYNQFGNVAERYRRWRTTQIANILGRIFQGVATLWGAYTLSFFLLHAVPGDSIRILLGGGVNGGAITEDQLNQLRSEYGFDRPVVVQYLDSLWGVFHGDLGRSIQTGRHVTSMIVEVFPNTLALALFSLALGALVGSCLAVFMILAARSSTKSALGALPALGTALPTFWIGLLLMNVFSFKMGLVPAYGTGGVRHLLLPGATLSIPVAGYLAQVFYKSLQMEMGLAYVDTARSKGVGGLSLIFKHVARNAFLPAMTVAGTIFGFAFASSVVIETVFGRVGIGSSLQQAVLTRDIPVVQGIVLVVAAIFVGVNMIVDVLYPILDPRMRQVRYVHQYAAIDQAIEIEGLHQ